MSELNIKIRKVQDNGSAFKANPDTLYLGGMRSAKVDRLHFEVPEEWRACTISLHVQRLSGTLPDPQILDENNSVLVDRRWTLEAQGHWMLLAMDENGYIAMSKSGQYTCYETIDTDSTTEALTPSIYEQFVAQVTSWANQAKESMNAAAGSAKKAGEEADRAEQAVAGLDQTRTDSIQAVQTAQNVATTAVEQKKTDAVQAVGNKLTESLGELDTAKGTALDEVADATQEAKNAAAYSKASAEKSASEAAKAESSAGAAKKSESNSATSEKNAKASEEASAKNKADAEAAAGRAAAIVSTDTTLAIPGAPADAEETGKQLKERYTKEDADALLKKKLDLTGGKLTGKLTIQAIAGFDDFAVTSDSADHDAGFFAQNLATNAALSFGIAGNGAASGIYDHIQGQWIINRPVGTRQTWFSGDGFYFENYLDFLQTNVGLRWRNADGSKVDVRAISQQNLFQMTFTAADGTPEYGFVNVFGDKTMEIDAYNILAIRNLANNQWTNLFDAVVVAYNTNCVRLGDGTQICWGAVSFPALTANGMTGVNVGFQAPFANTDYVMVSTQMGDSGNTDGTAVRNVVRYTTGADLYVFNNRPATPPAGTVYGWIAIGRWK